MKVYLVENYDFESSYICKAFDSLEKAERYIKERKEYDIQNELEQNNGIPEEYKSEDWEEITYEQAKVVAEYCYSYRIKEMAVE